MTLLFATPAANTRRPQPQSLRPFRPGQTHLSVRSGWTSGRLTPRLSFIRFCRQHRFDVQCLRLDNDACFKSDNFSCRGAVAGIQMEFSSPHSPHQNGLIERTWRTLSESTFAMLDSSGLKTTFWEYAIQTAAFLWLEAIKEELSAHAARQTWEATLLPAQDCPWQDVLHPPRLCG